MSCEIVEKSKGGSGGLSPRVVFRMVYLSDSGWGHKDFEVSYPIVVTITRRRAIAVKSEIMDNRLSKSGILSNALKKSKYYSNLDFFVQQYM